MRVKMAIKTFGHIFAVDEELTSIKRHVLKSLFGFYELGRFPNKNKEKEMRFNNEIKILGK